MERFLTNFTSFLHATLPATAVTKIVSNSNIASFQKKEEERCNKLFHQPRISKFGKTGLLRAY